MRWPFRRGARRGLGAAVVDLPSAPLHAPAVVAAPEPVAHEPVAYEPGGYEPVAYEVVAHEPVAYEPVAHEPVAYEPVLAEVPEPPAPVATVDVPRVGLGFRDGTTTELDPWSEASRALEALAGELVRAG